MSETVQKAKKILDRSGIQGKVEGEQRNEFNGRELTLMLKTVQKTAHLVTKVSAATSGTDFCQMYVTVKGEAPPKITVLL